MTGKGWIILAIVLLALGGGSLLIEGFSYVTQETVLEAGPLEVTAETEERVGLPVWVSVGLLAAGVVALIGGVTGKPGS